MSHVLFVCLRNAGRSQMSEALFARAAGGRHSASSAGTTPAERVHPDECPFIPGKRYIDWDLPDPNRRPLEEVRATRDDIARRVEDLVAELDGDL
jgi:arsenate reductase (thioredoxin)